MNTGFPIPPTLEAANVFTRRAEHNLRDWLAQLPGPGREICITKEKELFRMFVSIVDYFSVYY